MNNIKEFLNKFEEKICKKYYKDLLQDASISNHYISILEKYNKFYINNDIFIIEYIYNNFNNDTKCLELFAGIGQSAMGLYNIGFKYIGILDYLKSRCEISKKICKEEKFNIDIFEADFFKDNNLFNYDIIFCNNAVATPLTFGPSGIDCINWDHINYFQIDELEYVKLIKSGTNIKYQSKCIDIQVNIYEKFFKKNNKKDIIINAEYYGKEKLEQNVTFYKINCVP